MCEFIELLTIKCTNLKTRPVFEPLFILDRNSTVYVFTPKHKLWPCLIKNDHNLYFCVKNIIVVLFLGRLKSGSKAGRVFRVVHLMVRRSN